MPIGVRHGRIGFAASSIVAFASFGFVEAEDRDVDLPSLSRFATHKSDRFVVDFEVVRSGHPFLGELARRPHAGAHVYFQAPSRDADPADPSTYPAIHAVAGGRVARIDEYFELRPLYDRKLGRSIPNRRYGVTLAIARRDGRAVHFHYSIEPMMDPGDPDFYKPFILVRRDQQVRKGDVIARMYLPTNPDRNRNSHIHFHLKVDGERHFLAPDIFDDRVVRLFHDRWGDRGFDGATPLPPCMGYKLSQREKPFRGDLEIGAQKRPGSARK